MIDVVCLQYRACKLREQIIFFVGRTIRSNYADCSAAILIPNLTEFLPNRFKRLFPCRRSQLAILPNERLCEPFLVMRKVKSVAPLHAEEVAVDPALIAVISTDDLRTGVAAAHPERRLAAVAAVRADRADVVHLPRTCLVAIRARSQRPDGANVDAHSAFFAVEVIGFIRRNDRANAAVLDSERPN